MTSSPYSAQAALRGYFYQFRLALLHSLRRLRKLGAGTDRAFQVCLECEDDISFRNAQGETQEALQAKHHDSEAATLTDKHPDFWRTLRIWCDLWEDLQRRREPLPQFCLLTTATVQEGSGVALLARAEQTDDDLSGRTEADLDTALAKIVQAAKSSGNEKTEESRQRFLQLDKYTQRRLLRHVFICPGQAPIADLDHALESALSGVVPREKLAELREAVESWWLAQIEECIKRNAEIRMDSLAMEAQLDYFREVYGLRDALQYHLHSLSSEEEKAFMNYKFIKQLSQIRANDDQIYKAKIDYHSANKNRAEWHREGKVSNGELQEYDEDLEDIWSRIFLAKKARCAPDASEDERVETGRRIYESVETYPMDMPRIRRERYKLSLKMGSYHALADRLVVGWHPEYRQRLQGAEGEDEA